MRNLLLAATVMILGCTSAAHETGSAAAVPHPASFPSDLEAVVSRAPRAPIVASWLVLSSSPGRVVLVAHIEIRVALLVPMQVNVRIPSGIRLVSGPASFEVAPSDEPRVVEQEVVVDTDGREPADDLVLEIDMAGDGFGFHAEENYRFGRVGTASAALRADGPSLKIGSLDLGPSVAVAP